jgi:hypothetical protein
LILSISALLLLGVMVLVLCRYAGLRGSHAAVCVLFGFYLAGSSLAPTIGAFAETLAGLITGR